MLNMFVLLYADENACELQKALDEVHAYCGMYKLTVNIKNVERFTTFKYGNNTIEVVSDYIYLRITMNFNNKFNKAMKKIRSRSESLIFNVGQNFKN